MYPRSRPGWSEIETKDRKSGLKFLRKAQQALCASTIGHLGSAGSSQRASRFDVNSAHGHSPRYNNCTQFEIASSQSRNDRSGADIDILGLRNAFFGFNGAPEWRFGAFRLTFTTDSNCDCIDIVL